MLSGKWKNRIVGSIVAKWVTSPHCLVIIIIIVLSSWLLLLWWCAQLRNIDLSDFHDAVRRIRSSVPTSTIQQYEKWNEEFGDVTLANRQGASQPDADESQPWNSSYVLMMPGLHNLLRGKFTPCNQLQQQSVRIFSRPIRRMLSATVSTTVQRLQELESTPAVLNFVGKSQPYHKGPWL